MTLVGHQQWAAEYCTVQTYLYREKQHFFISDVFFTSLMSLYVRHKWGVGLDCRKKGCYLKMLTCWMHSREYRLLATITFPAISDSGSFQINH